jgi:hypothetical protein
VGHPHLAVVGGADDERVVEQPGLIEGVQQRDQSGVGRFDEIAVEVDVVALLRLITQRTETQIRPGVESPLGGRFGREILVDGRGQADLAVEPGLGFVAAVLPDTGVGEHVVRVHQRDDEEKGLATGGDGAQVLQHALLTIRRITAAVHDATIVVGIAPTELADVPVLAGVGRVPTIEAIGSDVSGRPILWVIQVRDWLAEMPFPLVGDVVPRGCENGRHVGQVAGQDALGHREAGTEAEGIGHPVLRREEPGEEAGPAGRAHAGIAERVVERDPVLAEASHAGQVPLFPAGGKMLDGALLVGQEQDHVHPPDRDAVFGSCGPSKPGFERGKSEGRGAEEIATPHVHDVPLPGRWVVRLFNNRS